MTIRIRRVPELEHGFQKGIGVDRSGRSCMRAEEPFSRLYCNFSPAIRLRVVGRCDSVMNAPLLQEFVRHTGCKFGPSVAREFLWDAKSGEDLTQATDKPCCPRC